MFDGIQSQKTLNLAYSGYFLNTIWVIKYGTNLTLLYLSICLLR